MTTQTQELATTGRVGQDVVSIIIVAYNHEEFIADCIDSCLQQAGPDHALQIVIADDGSPDGTGDIIRRYAAEHPDVIVPVISPRNTGIASNFNRGIEAATGQFMAWLGGDDIMLPQKIERQVAFLRERPQAFGCYHDAEVFSWPADKTLGLFSQLYAGRAASAEKVDCRKMIDPKYQMLPSTVMIRSEHVRHRFDDRLRFHNDFLFDLEVIVPDGAYWRMDGVFARYRKHEKSIGLDPTTQARMLEENLMVGAIMESRYPYLAPQIAKRQIYYISIAAIRALKSGNARHFRDLCTLLRVKGGFVRSTLVFLFGRLLVKLDQPQNRKIAMKIRNLVSW